MVDNNSDRKGIQANPLAVASEADDDGIEGLPVAAPERRDDEAPDPLAKALRSVDHSTVPDRSSSFHTRTLQVPLWVTSNRRPYHVPASKAIRS